MLPLFSRKPMNFRILFFSLTLFCLVNFFGWQSISARVQLDHSYAPVLANLNNGPRAILLLPDGKIIAIRLVSRNILGSQEYKVTRFNSDGSIDQIFDSVVMSRGDGGLLMQPDGKILVLSSNILVNGENRGGIVRLNADGTFDTSFDATWVIGAGGGLIQPDGRIVIGAAFFYEGIVQGKIVRLNTDGSRDSSFTIGASGTPMALQPDGKILTSQGTYSSLDIQRLNADGTPDVAFSRNLPNSWALGHVSTIIVQPDGKILVGGADIIRLNSDGTRDDSFAPGMVYYQYQIYGMVRQPDGKIIIGGSPFYYDVPTEMTRKRLTRINPDGTQDNTFDAKTSEDFDFNVIAPLALRSDGKILASWIFGRNDQSRNALVVLNEDGSLDQTFSADFGKKAGYATLAINQPDGKILVAGNFLEANSFPTSALTRLNVDGTTDTSFIFSEQITGNISALAVQTDGKILIGGNFRFNNQKNYAVFRLNPNGSIDSSFAPGIISSPAVSVRYSFFIYALVIQPDGKILVGGGFQNYANSARSNFVRLNADGTVDASYNVTSSGVYKMLVQPDGKIIVQGSLTENGNTRVNPRLNTDGSIDPTFNLSADISVVLAVAPDGKLAAGGFIYNIENRLPVAYRLNSDGSRDASFNPTLVPGNAITDAVFQSDGRMIVASSSISRLNLNGGINTVFVPSADVSDLLISADNRLIAVGRFSYINNTQRTGIARFLLNAADYDFDGDGRADIGVFRPPTGVWYLRQSSNGFYALQFGLSTDKPVPADYDGDGKTDIAVYRAGIWYLQKSMEGFTEIEFGDGEDIPQPGDYDGDGRADIAVWRPANGTWYVLNAATNQFKAFQFGSAADKPVAADYDNDGKADYAVFRPTNGTWYLQKSSQGFAAVQFGIFTDKPVPADYDGDGRTDVAVFRPSNGVWYLQRSQAGFTAAAFGLGTDLPTPADYDGDERADISVFREGTWFRLNSANGAFYAEQFGAATDKPARLALVP